MIFVGAIQLCATPAVAGLVVLDFNEAPSGSYLTGPIFEDGFVMTVDSGHYDIFGDTDPFLNTDDDLGFRDLSQLTFFREGGGLFNAESLVVGIPSVADNFSLIAVGNTGEVFVPSVAGLYAFGEDFHEITALVVRQNASGRFAFDDLTLSVPMPNPSISVLFFVALLGLFFNHAGKRTAGRGSMGCHC